jgi:hypothetical protein
MGYLWKVFFELGPTFALAGLPSVVNAPLRKGK